MCRFQICGAVIASGDDLSGGTLLSFGIALIGAVVVLLIFLRRRIAHAVEPATDDAAELPEDSSGRAYPSLPGDLRTIPEWISKNAPFEVVAAFAPVLTQDNAAPLYLDALYEFAPKEMAPCVSPAERRARGRVLRERHARLAFLQTRDPKTVSQAERAEIVADYREAFEKLSEAQTRKLCVFESPPGIKSGAPHALAARSAAWLLRWRTEAALTAGQIDAAIDDVALGLRLGRDVRPRGNLLCQIESMAIDVRTLDGCVAPILNARGLSVIHCERLMDALSTHATQAIDPLAEGLRYEYPLMRDAFHSLEMKEDLGAKVGWPGLTYGQISINFVKFLGRETGRDGDELARQIDRDLADMTGSDFAAEVELLNRAYATLMERANRRERRLGDAFAEVQAIYQNSKLQKYATITFEVAHEAFRRDRTRIAGYKCLAALRRWKMENGDESPADLETVCKAAGLNAIPFDEYAGGPFQSAVMDGEFVIVSTGPEAPNDAEEQRAVVGKRPGDWVFRLGPVS